MINCVVTSPSETITYTDLISVTLPALSGQMQVNLNHAESFIALKKGIILMKNESEKIDKIQIEEGSCYIQNNIVTILV